jgi:WD40 repeat protein
VLVGWNALTLHSKVFFVVCVAVLVAVGVGLGTFPNTTDTPNSTPPAVPFTPPAVTAKGSDSQVDVFGDPLPKGAIARLGTQRFLKYSRTRDFALSPDGRTIAVGDENFTLLDAVTGQVIRHQSSVRVGGVYTFPGQEGDFTTPGIFWRPDGRGVALIGRYSWDKYLWDCTDPKDVPPTFEPQPNDVLPPVPPEGAISCAAVSEDGKWIAIARQPSDPNRRVVQVYPCKTGKHISDLKADRTLGPFSTASERIWFAADGRELILARADHTVIVLDAANGKELRRATLPKWAVIATSPDGKFVAIVPRHAERDVWHTGDETVRVWDLIKGKEVWKFPRPGDSISGLAFTPDSKHLITSDLEFEFRKWDLASGKETAVRQAWNGLDTMSVVAVSADGKRFATSRTSTSIKLWDAGTGTHVNPLTTHGDAVAGVAVSPDSRLVATVGYDGTLRVWQTTSGKQVCTRSAQRVNPRGMEYGSRRAVTFTPDGRGVIFDAAGVLTMADPTTGKPLDRPAA